MILFQYKITLFGEIFTITRINILQQEKVVDFHHCEKQLLRNFMTGSARFRLAYHKCWLTTEKINFFFLRARHVLNDIKVNNGRKKSHKWIGTSFRLLTRLLTLAMRLTFKTKINVKRFWSSLASLRLYIFREFMVNSK